MTFKSPTQPLCRYCAAKIKKATDTTYFGDRAQFVESRKDIRPRSLAEAQRYVNGKIVSNEWRMKRESENYHDVGYDRVSRDYIDKVSTWDGESYVDQFFCNGDHAKRFAYVMARAGSCTVAYSKARGHKAA